MTTETMPKVVVLCQNPACTTRDGSRHVLTVITTAYAVVEQTCRYCKTKNTRIVVNGVVLESR